VALPAELFPLRHSSRKPLSLVRPSVQTRMRVQVAWLPLPPSQRVFATRQSARRK
jgi:hypothetical protein